MLERRRPPRRRRCGGHRLRRAGCGCGYRCAGVPAVRWWSIPRSPLPRPASVPYPTRQRRGAGAHARTTAATELSEQASADPPQAVRTAVHHQRRGERFVVGCGLAGARIWPGAGGSQATQVAVAWLQAYRTALRRSGGCLGGSGASGGHARPGRRLRTPRRGRPGAGLAGLGSTALRWRRRGCGGHRSGRGTAHDRRGQRAGVGNRVGAGGCPRRQRRAMGLFDPRG